MIEVGAEIYLKSSPTVEMDVSRIVGELVWVRYLFLGRQEETVIHADLLEEAPDGSQGEAE